MEIDGKMRETSETTENVGNNRKHRKQRKTSETTECRKTTENIGNVGIGTGGNMVHDIEPILFLKIFFSLSAFYLTNMVST